ncbi:tripartite tricarboxylate transporter substrate binding protein [Modestobacter sp. Leaf380]|uniref:tripartite tricarboxylate transporter substrate binding protein n=1 Tax=Modestobacter sp. Leaf380 TaxID=1736356 RepID=UPI0006F9F90B|nr:tripartite tricarboxylate transporter substrate binding protein [Modestobacter sp. Leaf380]KQS63996.1 C4-dicarboxylate ABC transporter substrate-binding protein [Modestobacter sp. Leaf380]
MALPVSWATMGAMRAVAGLLVVLAVLTGCSGGRDPVTDLRVMVPNTVGGGYDVTARTAVRVLEETGLAEGVEVFQLPGSGGTVGLARLSGEAGNGDLLMSMGLGLLAASRAGEVPTTVADVTPVARLLEESGAVLVAADSPYRSMDDLVAAWTADPASFVVGGGSAPAGPDSLLALRLAAALGIAPADVDYLGFDGGGDLVPALLSGQVQVALSGNAEFADQLAGGEVRALATTGAERVRAVDAPTLRELGIDVVFSNWRGLVAPPGLTEAEVRRLTDLVLALHDTPQWRAALTTNSWTDALLTGPEFAAFLTGQQQLVDDTLTQLR